MPKCELLLTTRDGQILGGTIVLDGGKITGHAEDGHEKLIATVLENPTHDGVNLVDRREDAEALFRTLPMQYNGSYVRAEIVAEKSDR